MVAKEQVQSGQETTSATRGLDSDLDPESSLVHDTLVRKYGEAMLRVGQLETEVADLSRRLHEAYRGGTHAAGSGHRDQHPDLGVLMAKIENLEKHLYTSSPTGPPPANEAGAAYASEEIASPSREGEDHVTQLRVQIAGMANQLARTQRELEEVQTASANRRRRRDKGKRRPRWQFWKRRSGQ